MLANFSFLRSAMRSAKGNRRKKTVCISTSGSMVCHLFICCTVSEQNTHIIAAGIENTVNKNFAAVSTVEANVIAAYNKAIIAL